MRVEIIISHGHVKLTRPVYLKPEAPIRYAIKIPDEAVTPDRDWLPEEFDKKFTLQYPKAARGSLQERYNQILGDLARTRPPASLGDDFQTLQDAIEERYSER